MKALLALSACAAVALLALLMYPGDGTPRVEVTPAGANAPVPMPTSPTPATAATPTSETTHAGPTGIAGAAPEQSDASPSAQPALLLPVQGLRPEQLHDTFTDARSEGRGHDAIDIMAPAGTPVLAVADGHVEKLFDSKRGGLTVYQFEPSGRLAYYYAHLQRYADGLAEGQPIHRGQVIGYVGSTGNASPDAPHLHFAIFVLGPERRWWEGTAVNPYPILRGDAPLPLPSCTSADMKQEQSHWMISHAAAVKRFPPARG